MIKLLQVTIAADNVAQMLSVTSIKCNKVFIQSKIGNSNPVYIGDSSVDASASLGFAINSDIPTINVWPLRLLSSVGNEFDLSEIYISGSKDDVVNVLYWIM